MRKFIFGLVVLLTVLFVISRTAEIQELLSVLRRASLRHLAPAVLLQLLWFPCATQAYRAIYRRLGMREPFPGMLRLFAASTFIGVLTPSGGLSSMAVFMTHARRRNYAAGRVLVGSILYLVSDYLVLLAVVAAGAGVLHSRGLLKGIEVVAAGLLALLVAGLILLLLLGWRAPRKLDRWITGLARGGNRVLRPVLRRPPFQESAAAHMARDISDGCAALRHGVRLMLRPLAWGFLGRSLQWLILACVLTAFALPLDALSIVAALGIGQLFVIISPTPGGIGFVEGAMTVVLNVLGLRIEEATVVALAFRGITFWIPFALGFLAFHHFSHVPGGAPDGEPAA